MEQMRLFFLATVHVDQASGHYSPAHTDTQGNPVPAVGWGWRTEGHGAELKLQRGLPHGDVRGRTLPSLLWVLRSSDPSAAVVAPSALPWNMVPPGVRRGGRSPAGLKMEGGNEEDEAVLSPPRSPEPGTHRTCGTQRAEGFSRCRSRAASSAGRARPEGTLGTI